jgi:hypothetical protein
MSADILSDPNHPHGTAEGFAKGCRGSHCPTPVTCREVYARYQGDYAFRRQIDAGASPAQIVAAEQEAADAAKAAARAARRSPTSAVLEARRAGLAKARAVLQAKRLPARVPSTPLQKTIHRLHAEKRTDAEIGSEIGKTREQVRAIRRYMHLPANRTRTLATAGVSSS